MTILFYDDDIEHRSIARTASIFLAGPTRRFHGRTPWRAEALETIVNRMPVVDVFVPEFRDGHFALERFAPGDSPVKWETTGMERSGITLFWMPFDRGEYLGLTTRSEVAAALVDAKKYHEYCDRLADYARGNGDPTPTFRPLWVLGMPPNTPADGYIRHHAALAGLHIHATLHTTLQATIAALEGFQ